MTARTRARRARRHREQRAAFYAAREAAVDRECAALRAMPRRLVQTAILGDLVGRAVEAGTVPRPEWDARNGAVRWRSLTEEQQGALRACHGLAASWPWDRAEEAVLGPTDVPRSTTPGPAEHGSGTRLSSGPDHDTDPATDAGPSQSKLGSERRSGPPSLSEAEPDTDRATDAGAGGRGYGIHAAWLDGGAGL